jgi:chemotaxis protein MotB
MTALLLVLMFVLTIFMVVQSVLRQTISSQDDELATLSEQVAGLAQALAMEQVSNAELQNSLSGARTEVAAQADLIAALRATVTARDADLRTAETRITSFEAQVAALLADRAAARALAAATAAERDLALGEAEALNLALAQARGEIDAQTEAARLAAARREALDALIADLQRQNAATEANLSQAQVALSEAEASRLADAAALAALRARLEGAEDELTAMTLALEAQRREAENTLTLLAAAEAAKRQLQQAFEARDAEALMRAAALAAAEAAMADLRQSAEAQKSEAERLADLLAAAEVARLEREGQLADKASEAERLAALLASTEATLAAGDAARIAAMTEAERLRALLDAAEMQRAAREAELGNASSEAERLARLLAEAQAARAAAESRAGGAATEAERLAAMLAAAEAARAEAEGRAGAQLSETERQAALLALANQALSAEQAVSAENARKMALLNQQVAELRGQLSELKAILDASAERDIANQVQVESLGSQLNAALAQVADEQRRRADLEAAERARLEAETRRLAEEAKQLSRYRSEFFGRLSELLAGREGVRVVGDRFVFSSEVLFQPGSADLSPEGQQQIAGVVALLNDLADQIPPEIDWIIRVDGHTDNAPLAGTGAFKDNWELSQGRALSVVRYMIGSLGFAPERLAATGFGEFRPVAEGTSPEARAQNRRIELKLTER